MKVVVAKFSNHKDIVNKYGNIKQKKNNKEGGNKRWIISIIARST